MKVRSVLSTAVAVAMLATLSGLADAAPRVPGKSTKGMDRALSRSRFTSRAEGTLPKGFVPAVAAQSRLHRYYVVMRAPAVAQRISQSGGKGLSGAEQRRARQGALQSQEGAIRQARSQGGKIVFRYGTLVNAFSTAISAKAAAALANRPDVASVQPVSIVRMNNESSVPFIGAPQVWSTFGVRGQGLTLALVDTGIDYTHADFGGSGDPADYENNDPNFIEPGTFPTSKVTGGHDFVGNNYDVLDADPTNDIPRPDFDPLDSDGHGTHTGGTCCGIGVPGTIGPGVAPDVKIRAYKVWDEGNSTDDVLVAAYERAVDPNQDGNVNDRAHVLSFSGGVSYGTLNSVEAVAAQRVVDVGTVFVASAGNSGNQPSGGSAYITGTPATARGVIGVAASIDEFLVRHIVINSSSDPIVLPDEGFMVHQGWSADLPPGGLTDDLFDGRAIDDIPDPENPSPADAHFCNPADVPPGSLTGQTVLVYKGSTGPGDCDGSLKAENAEAAGAEAVILVSLFGGLPFALGSGGRTIGIPTVMISGADGNAILDVLSPDESNHNYNDGAVNATLEEEESPVPGFDDAMTDFTSEGPARLTSDLKPDVSAPGFSIRSAGVGTGDGASVLSGTSMAAPHVSGVAVLVKQRHPTWPPDKVKAAIMNQVTPFMKNNNLSTPVPATVMGAGRVKAFDSAKLRSLAFPSSLSYGLEFAAGAQSEVQRFLVRNYDSVTHHYDASSAVRYSDLDPAIADVDLSLDGVSFGPTRSFNLAPNKQRWVWVRLTLDPSVISPAEQLFGWYYFHPNVDGTVMVVQDNPGKDFLRIPWHVAPLAASDSGLSEDFLDLTGGPATMEMTSGPAAGQPYGDLYLLGATDPVESVGEEDIVAIGARSFTGPVIDGTPEGVPTGTDPLVGLTWQQFLTNGDEPTEPIEFGVQTAAVHNTTETLEVDVKIDVGADGVFADPDLMADFLVVKLPEAGGTVCVFDLSLPDPFADCTATYFPDYNNYNGNGVGVVVDAQAIGLAGGISPVTTLSYQVTACTGRFSGDVPGTFCDTAGEFDETSGTYTSFLNATDPALDIDPLVCQGFWSLEMCDSGDPINVAVGSAAPGDNPTILALFPNNAPSRSPTLVETET
jgi:minor extracellular serine protease Vpr